METKEQILEKFGIRRKFIQRSKVTAYILSAGMILGSIYFLDNKPRLDRINPFYDNDISKYDSLSALANSTKKAKSLAYQYFPKDSLDNAINLMEKDIESIEETENFKLYQKRNSDLNRIILYSFFGSILLYLGADFVSLKLTRNFERKEKEELENLENRVS